MPIWYVRTEGRFLNVSNKAESDIAVTRVQKSSSNCPALKISSKSYGSLGSKTSTQYIRLSLPVKCNDKYSATGAKNDAMTSSGVGLPTPGSGTDEDRQTQGL